MLRSAQGEYLAKGIIRGRLEYSVVRESRPDLIVEIDEYLIAKGYEHLIEAHPVQPLSRSSKKKKR